MEIRLSGSDLVGVCYGMEGDNLPPPSEAIDLCKSYNITKIRIYTPDKDVLCALRGSGIEVMMGVLSRDIKELADPSNARTWVQDHVLDHWPEVKFRYISVGTEIMPYPRESETASIAPYVLSAMKNIHDAISAHGIENQVKVSTVTDLKLVGLLDPPSAGAFRAEVLSFISPIIEFLKETGAPLLVSVYPYWSYLGTMVDDTSISYALFTSSSPLMQDRQYKYRNVFDANLDSMYWALEKVDARNLEIVVCETGWPSEGSERGAAPIHGQTFYSNLVEHVKLGTPKRPRKPIETYLYSLFDENQTGYRECEKHFGLFLPDKTPKYRIS